MDDFTIDIDTFEHIVSDALDEMPDWVQRAVAEIAILIDDEPPADWHGQGVLLGRFQGVAGATPGSRAPMTLPARIELYRNPILRACHSRDDVVARVRKVLGHEIGHAMGVSEARLRELGWF